MLHSEVVFRRIRPLRKGHVGYLQLNSGWWYFRRGEVMWVQGTEDGEVGQRTGRRKSWDFQLAYCRPWLVGKEVGQL